MAIPGMRLARKDAAKLVIDKYRDQLAKFGVFPGDQVKNPNWVVGISLTHQEWEAVYEAFKVLAED